MGGVILDAIIMQLQRMDASLDTLSTELYQVNTCVDHISRRQACLGGFVDSPFPPSETFKDDDDFEDDDEDKDGGASSSSTNEMSA